MIAANKPEIILVNRELSDGSVNWPQVNIQKEFIYSHNPMIFFSFFKTGVSSYYPYNMEHILLIYLPGEEFDKYPKCDTQEVTYENNMEDQCYMRTSARGPTQTNAEHQTL